METIDVASEYEIKYLRAVSTQKTLQKSIQQGGKSRDAAKMQARVQKYAKKYGMELIREMIAAEKQFILRKYAVGPKYAMDFVVSIGHITIYSHPQNPSVKPKLEVHHVKYGFVAWWNECDFEYPQIWENLCRLGNYRADDISVIERESARMASMLGDDL